MLYSRLELCVRDVWIWMAQNYLKLIDDKTNYMYIIHESKKYLYNVSTIRIKIGNSKIHPAFNTSQENWGYI